MEVQPKKATAKGPAEWFTGDVWIDPIARGPAPSRLAVSAVHFTPGARTAWHAHSLGQTLYVTEGEGLIQSRGESIVSIRSGNTIHTPAEEWHWHGATPDHFMAHLTITEGDAQWGEHVTDAEYHGGADS
jgi:quercetin dioxygenase-like cupin family protein